MYLGPSTLNCTYQNALQAIFRIVKLTKLFWRLIIWKKRILAKMKTYCLPLDEKRASRKKHARSRALIYRHSAHFACNLSVIIQSISVMFSVHVFKHKDSFGKFENISKIICSRRRILVFDHDYEGISLSSNDLPSTDTVITYNY